MLEQLGNYYRSQGILSTHFTCPHSDSCREGYEETFTGPKSASVSTGYEHGNLPRLLFLSLDSGSGHEDANARLPHAVRHGMENVQVNELAINRHWYRTHELAWYILRQYRPDLDIEDTKRFFAHTNSAKCCQNKPDGSQADARLFRNCRRYLAGEIRVLRPDVIVTQGNKAKMGLQRIIEIRERINDLACIIVFDGRLLFWLHTYHPRYGGYYAQCGYDHETQRCEGWQQYSEYISRFVDGMLGGQAE